MGLPQPRVSGTSSTFTLPAAVIGTIAFCFTGLLSIGDPDSPWTIGYVFWPALPAAGGPRSSARGSGPPARAGFPAASCVSSSG